MDCHFPSPLPSREGIKGRGRLEGFTLMEVMIAMAILAIALVTIFQSQSQSVSMTGNSRFLTTASLLAQARMAEIEMLDMKDVRTENGDFGDAFPDYAWRVEVKDTDFDAVKKIELTITNSRLTINNQYLLELYRFILN
jgi:general secretion pathway protein I